MSFAGFVGSSPFWFAQLVAASEADKQMMRPSSWKRSPREIMNKWHVRMLFTLNPYMYTSHNDIFKSHKFTMSEAIPLQKLLMGTPALRNHPGLILVSSWSLSSWYHPVVAGACSGMEAIILASSCPIPIGQAPSWHHPGCNLGKSRCRPQTSDFVVQG